MPEFREKPKKIEAEQFLLDKKPWPKGVERYETGPYEYLLDGHLILNPGDWIITTSQGGHSVCEATEFEAAYELA